MPTPSRAARALGQQVADLSIAVPQVVASRLTQLALSGHRPTAGDRRELARMSNEKISAAWESWNAMATYAVSLNTAIALNAFSAWLPATPTRPPLPSTQEVLVNLANAGLRPYHGRAMANQKRLGKRKPRA